MNQYCFIQCVGRGKVPDEDKWKNNVSGGINRLVCALGGEGGYYIRGKKCTFERGILYFLPCYDDIPTWSSFESMENRLDHLFVNFELIPPIITKEVVAINPDYDLGLKNAFNCLMHIAEKSRNRIVNLGESDLNYLKATVIYVMEKIVENSGVRLLEDKIVISALEKMHRRFSEKITVQGIASELYISCNGLIRRFEKTLGITPYNYLKQLRIRTANAMRQEGATLEEASAKCGYSDSVALLHAISAEKRLPIIK